MMQWETRSAKSWNSLIVNEFGPRICQPLGGSFHANLSLVRGRNGLIVANARSSGARIRQEATGGQEQQLIVHLQLAGRSLTQQAGRAIVLSAGDFLLLDSAQAYEVEFDDPTNICVLRFPEAELRARVPMAQDLLLQPFAAAQAGTDLFSSFVGTFWDLSRRHSLEDLGIELTDTLLSLFSTAVRPAGARLLADRGRDAERWYAIELYIIENLHRPALDVAAIAAHVGRSVRSVQFLFASRGETVSSYILNRRLEMAAQLLSGGDRPAIMPLCLDCGFRDLSNFTKSFRRRYGMPPARYRDSLLA